MKVYGCNLSKVFCYGMVKMKCQVVSFFFLSFNNWGVYSTIEVLDDVNNYITSFLRTSLHAVRYLDIIIHFHGM